MNKLSDVMIIDRYEVEMLLPLLQKGWMIMVKGVRGKKPTPEMLLIDKLFKQFRSFVNED